MVDSCGGFIVLHSSTRAISAETERKGSAKANVSDQISS